MLSGLPAGGERWVILPDDGLTSLPGAGAGGLDDGALEAVRARVQEVCTSCDSEVAARPALHAGQLAQVEVVAVDDVGGEGDDGGAQARVPAGRQAEGLRQDPVQGGRAGCEDLGLGAAQERLARLGDDGVEGGGGHGGHAGLPDPGDVARGQVGQRVQRLRLDVLEGLLEGGGQAVAPGLAHRHGASVTLQNIS